MRYLVIDKHKFKMPDGDPDVGINAVMDAYSNLKDVWEPNTTRMVKRKIKKGMTCVDCGASIGYFTLLLARCVGETGKVISFEPTPNQFPYIMANVEANGYKNWTFPQNKAAWDKDEVIKMPPIDKKWDCDAVNVDNHLKKLGIERVDFIKIDVDGSERHVLLGLENTFKNNPDLQIMFEYYPRCLKELNENPEEVWKLVNKYFDLKLIPGDLDPRDGGNYWGKRKKNI